MPFDMQSRSHMLFDKRELIKNWRIKEKILSMNTFTERILIVTIHGQF